MQHALGGSLCASWYGPWYNRAASALSVTYLTQQQAQTRMIFLLFLFYHLRLDLNKTWGSVSGLEHYHGSRKQTEPDLDMGPLVLQVAPAFNGITFPMGTINYILTLIWI